MSNINTSTFIELYDKFSKQFTNLQRAFEVTTTKGKELSSSTYNVAKSFVTGGKELENFRNKLNNTGNSYNQLLSIMGSVIKPENLSGFLKGNIAEAGNRQEMSFEVGTFLKGGNTKKIEDMANKIADTGISTYKDAMETAYTFLSAGISEEETKVGSDIASKVAVLTKGNAGEIANVMSTAAKDFHLSMQQTGDILAKTQNIFQIKDFTQLEEGLKYVAASASSLNIPLSQSAILIGTLNNAGQVGSMAGAGISNILSSLSKASNSLNIAIPKAKDGSLDMVKWVSLVKNKLQGDFGNNDKYKDKTLTKLFGSEGAKSFQILANRSYELQEKFGELENSKGFVDEKTTNYMQLFNTQVEALHNSFAHLEDSLGKVLLPILTFVVSEIASMTSWFANLTAKHEYLADAINVVITGIIGLASWGLF